MAVAASQLAELAATASYHAVLLSPDLWLGVFPCLDRGSKVALRGVCGALRSQVDGAIEVVASPVAGFSPHALTASLLRWPALKHLTLVMAVGSSASDLAPLATTTLAGLKSLAVSQVGCGHACTVRMHHAWCPKRSQARARVHEPHAARACHAPMQLLIAPCSSDHPLRPVQL
jgi:hypothetical protein